MLIGYRTYIAAALVAGFGALAAADWNSVLANPKTGWSLVATGVLMAIMRSITSTPPGTKK